MFYLIQDDVIEHWWMGKMANDNQTCVALQWRGEIISESGLRQCDGLSWVAVSDLVQANAEQSNPPLPLKCYIDAAYQVEHNFATGPARVSCCVTIENTSEQTLCHFNACSTVWPVWASVPLSGVAHRRNRSNW